MCISGVGFNPTVEGQHLTFDLFGLYNGVFAMKDHQTGTVWSHLDGAALQGALIGSRLEVIALVHVTWDEWRTLHPDTLVLSADTEWKDRYHSRSLGRPGLSRPFIRSLERWDSRLPEATLVLGVEVKGAYAAYPLKVLEVRDLVVNDELAGKPIVAWYVPQAISTAAYSRVVGGRTLDFHVSDDGRFQDVQTGSRWDLQGLAISGPLEGTQLRHATSFISEWYG